MKKRRYKKAETFFSVWGGGGGVISGLCILGDGPFLCARWTNMSRMDIYAPRGGRRNKSERDGEKQTCCTWLRGDGDLAGQGEHFSTQTRGKERERGENVKTSSFPQCLLIKLLILPFKFMTMAPKISSPPLILFFPLFYGLAPPPHLELELYHL